MNFKYVFNKYFDLIGCSGKELSDKTDISPSLISGYRTGKRTLKYKSKNFEKIVNGLFILSKEKKINLDIDILRNELGKFLHKDIIDFNVFLKNFIYLIDKLSINVANLAKYVGFDSSYISKIKSGVRKPHDIENFVSSIAHYITENYYDDDLIKKIILHDSFTNENDFYNIIYQWLTTNNQIDDNNSSIEKFMKQLDEFDLNSFYNNYYEWLKENKYIEDDNKIIDAIINKLDDFNSNDYLKAFNSEELLIPDLTNKFNKTTIYYGFDGYKKAQIDILKQIAFYKSDEDVFLYNNMPMIEANNDLEFTKEYMLYLAFILKKGLKLNIVHDIDRPLRELVLGIGGWTALYMTGMINPCYFKKSFKSPYLHIDCTSQNVVLHGDCIADNLDSAKFTVSNRKSDVDFYKNRSNLLIKKTEPLMSIYSLENKDDFLNFDFPSDVDRRNIILGLPFYTLSDHLLDKILTHNNVSNKDKEAIKEYFVKEKNRVNKCLKNYSIIDEVSILSKEDFEKTGAYLDLSFLFKDTKIKYTYNEYKEHIKLLNEFKSKNKNYSFISHSIPFKNINICIYKGKCVIISKTSNPITHFVIYHPRFINAIEKFEISKKRL